MRGIYVKILSLDFYHQFKNSLKYYMNLKCYLMIVRNYEC